MRAGHAWHRRLDAIVFLSYRRSFETSAKFFKFSCGSESADGLPWILGRRSSHCRWRAAYPRPAGSGSFSCTSEPYRSVRVRLSRQFRLKQKKLAVKASSRDLTCRWIAECIVDDKYGGLSMDGQWYITRDQQRSGPFSWLQLQQFAYAGQLVPTDALWTEGMSEWGWASTIPGLFSPPATSLPLPSTHSSVSEPRSNRDAATESATTRQSRKTNNPSSPNGLLKPQVDARRARSNSNSIYTTLKLIGGVMLGLYCLILVIAVVAEKSSSEEDNKQATSTATEGTKRSPRTEIDLSNGRPPIDTLIEYHNIGKRFKLTKLDVESPNGAYGDLFESLAGGRCVIYVGQHKLHNQMVSVMFGEVAGSNRLAAAVIECPFDTSRDVTYGNTTTALSDFIKELLPNADVKKLIAENSTSLAVGNDVTRRLGKAEMTVQYRAANKLFVVVIRVFE